MCMCWVYHGCSSRRVCGWYQGGYGDRGYREGAIPGYYPATARRSHTSGAGPGSPGTGLEWVGMGPGASELPDHPLRTPTGSYGARSAVRHLSSGKSRLLTNKGEI